MSRYRAGPWPGLTPRGAGILLACAVFLGAGQLLVGPPTRAIPDLPLVAATAVLPLVVGVRVTRTPGAASAICGAYLLPASLVSLLESNAAPPPLLLVPAVAFDLALWLQPQHLATLLRRHAAPGRASRLTTPRAAMAGALFGLVLATLEPPFRRFLGANPEAWAPDSVALAAVSSAAVCALLARLLTARDTAA